MSSLISFVPKNVMLIIILIWNFSLLDVFMYLGYNRSKCKSDQTDPIQHRNEEQNKGP